jgi:hypothetical protein
MLQTWHKMSPATSADFSRVSSKSIIHEQVLGDDVAAFALAHVFFDECAALPQETSYPFPSPELKIQNATSIVLSYISCSLTFVVFVVPCNFLRSTHCSKLAWKVM